MRCKINTYVLDIVDEDVDSFELRVSWCLPHPIKTVDLNASLGVDVVLIPGPALLIAPESVFGGKEALEGDVVLLRLGNDAVEQRLDLLSTDVIFLSIAYLMVCLMARVS